MDENKIYSDSELEKKLSSFPLWDLQNGRIVRELSAADFADAVRIVKIVAGIAESLDHYPDIAIYGWNKIRVETMTFSLGVITDLDFNLAEKIDELKTI